MTSIEGVEFLAIQDQFFELLLVCARAIDLFNGAAGMRNEGGEGQNREDNKSSRQKPFACESIDDLVPPTVLALQVVLLALVLLVSPAIGGIDDVFVLHVPARMVRG